MDAQTAQAALQKICNAQSFKKSVLALTAQELATNLTDVQERALLENVNSTTCGTQYLCGNLEYLTVNIMSFLFHKYLIIRQLTHSSRKKLQ